MLYDAITTTILDFIISLGKKKKGNWYKVKPQYLWKVQIKHLVLVQKQKYEMCQK